MNITPTFDIQATTGSGTCSPQRYGREVPENIAQILVSPPKQYQRIHVKVKYGKENRRLSLPSKITYAELIQVIRFFFNIDDMKPFVRTEYTDFEGETVTFNTDEELRELGFQAYGAVVCDKRLMPVVITVS